MHPGMPEGKKTSAQYSRLKTFSRRSLPSLRHVRRSDSSTLYCGNPW